MSDESESPAAAAAAGKETQLGQRLFQLFLLTLAVSTASYARTTVGPLQEAIKASLGLSDNQIAVLQGIAMALPIALASVPLGLLADRASRARMLVFFLCLGVAACLTTALAPDFRALLFSRALTALAGAGVGIAAYSMVGDLFAPTWRGRAVTVMAFGEVSGAPVAFALGGAFLITAPETGAFHLEDWRLALLWMVGALVVPVLLVLLLVREPARTGIVEKKRPLRAVWPELWRYRSVVAPLHLARATLCIGEGTVFVWGAPFFARSYHLPPDQIGVIMGVVLLVAGLLGPALGGPLVDFCQRRGGSRRAVTVMGGIALLSVPAALFALMPSANLASLMLGIYLILGFSIFTASLSLILIVIPGELRGLNLGASLIVASLFFVGLAPLAVSRLSTALGGEMMLGKALAIVCVTMSLISATVLLFGRRYFPGLGDGAPARDHRQTSDGTHIKAAIGSE